MNLFTRWKDKASEFIDVRVGLFKLSLIERTSTLLGNLMLAFIYLFLALAVLTFLGFGLMETFSELVHSRVGGAFITAGVFALLLVLLFAVRKLIIRSFAGIFVRILTEPNEGDDDTDSGTPIKVDGD
jgi:Zn-dependent protease with chaperone function